MLRCLPVKAGSSDVILLHALPVLIAPGKIALRTGITLVRGSAVPSDRLFPALLYAPAGLIAKAQTALSRRMALLRRFHCLLVVLLRTDTPAVCLPQ